MKLIKEPFENFAHEQGYESGAELFDELGLNRKSYEHFKKEVPIGKEALRTLCWELGSVEVCFVITGDYPMPPPEFMDKFKNTYISFAPRIRVEWTPGLYYYMNGKRKINLRSIYPTFSVDYERGIKGVFKSTGEYERIEFDLQHQIRMGLMRNIYYRFGFGAFTNQDELYFVDFANFSRHNLPVGWNDEIGGVFQVLDSRWYNSSRRYVRGHFTYEAPFLILRHLMKYTRYVQNERIYVSALCMPHLQPYMEVGYGIGTHVFDVGVFVSSENWKFGRIGCKLTFELFNR